MGILDKVFGKKEEEKKGHHQKEKTAEKKIAEKDESGNYINQKELYKKEKEEKKKVNEEKRKKEQIELEKKKEEERILKTQKAKEEEQSRQEKLEAERKAQEEKKKEKKQQPKEKVEEEKLEMFGFEVETLTRGELIDVEVMSYDGENFLVRSLKNYQEAKLPKTEIENYEVNVGDELEVQVWKFYAEEFYVSQRRGANKKILKERMKDVEKNQVLKGTVESFNNPIFMVKLENGLKGKIFIRRMDTEFVEDGNQYVGNEYEFRIIEVFENLNIQCELDRRSVLLDQLDTVFDEVSSGDILDVTSYKFNKGGLEFSYKGARGFVPMRELSHKYYETIDDAKEDFTGPIQVKIREIKGEGQRKEIIGSIKDTGNEPFEEFIKEIKVGDIVTKPVAKVENYGLFLQLAPGVRGLAHQNDFSMEINATYREIEVGTELTGKIILIDEEKKQINISLNLNKEAEDEYLNSLNVGDLIEVTDFKFNRGGLEFISNGIRGFVPVREFSYEYFEYPEDAKDKIKAPFNIKVTEFKEQRGSVDIIGSIKDTLKTPWDRVVAEYKIGDIVTLPIAYKESYGVFMQVNEGVRGLLHNSEYTSQGEELLSSLYDGDEMTVKVVKIDEGSKQIDFSMKLDDSQNME